MPDTKIFPFRLNTRYVDGTEKLYMNPSCFFLYGLGSGINARLFVRPLPVMCKT